jgi:hypothetical protein
MKSLDVDHAALHETIKAILDAKAQGNHDKMEAGFVQLDVLSHHVVEKLNQLEQEVANHRQQSGHHTASSTVTKKVKAIGHHCDHC